MLEISGMRSTSSVPLLPCPLWHRVVATERVLSMGPKEVFDIYTESKQTELFENELFDHLTVCKQMTVDLNCS